MITWSSDVRDGSYIWNVPKKNIHDKGDIRCGAELVRHNCLLAACMSDDPPVKLLGGALLAAPERAPNIEQLLIADCCLRTMGIKISYLPANDNLLRDQVRYEPDLIPIRLFDASNSHSQLTYKLSLNSTLLRESRTDTWMLTAGYDKLDIPRVVKYLNLLRGILSEEVFYERICNLARTGEVGDGFRLSKDAVRDIFDATINEIDGLKHFCNILITNDSRLFGTGELD